MEFIKNWANCITLTIIVVAIAEMLVPEGATKKTVLLLTGIITSIVIATPVLSLIDKGFDLSEVMNIEQYFEDGKYANLTNSTISGQIDLLEETYSKEVRESFNRSYPGQKITDCKIRFYKDLDGKIKEIEKITVYMEGKAYPDTKRNIAILCEISEDKIEIIESGV